MGLVSTTNPAAESSFDTFVTAYVHDSIMNAEQTVAVEDLLTWADLPTNLDIDSRRSLVERVDAGSRNVHCSCPVCKGEGYVAESVRYDDSPALLGEAKCDHCEGAGELWFEGLVVWSIADALTQNDSTDDSMAVAAE